MMVSKVTYIIALLGMCAGYILGVNVNEVSKPLVHDLIEQHMSTQQKPEQTK